MYYLKYSFIKHAKTRYNCVIRSKFFYQGQCLLNGFYYVAVLMYISTSKQKLYILPFYLSVFLICHKTGNCTVIGHFLTKRIQRMKTLLNPLIPRNSWYRKKLKAYQCIHDKKIQSTNPPFKSRRRAALHIFFGIATQKGLLGSTWTPSLCENYNELRNTKYCVKITMYYNVLCENYNTIQNKNPETYLNFT